MNTIKPSFTALENFSWCERQVYYKRILKLPEPPSRYLTLGIQFHDAVEKTLRGVPVGELDPGVARALRALEPLLRTLPPFVDEQGPYIERWLPGHVGKVDYASTVRPTLAPGVTLYDWKLKFSDKRRRTAEALQPAVYVKLTPFRTVAFVELQYDSDAAPYVNVFDFDEESKTRWDRYIDEQIATLASRPADDERAWKLATIGHPLCSVKWCPFWERCPGGNGRC